jgi:hypothetical protein
MAEQILLAVSASSFVGWQELTCIVSQRNVPESDLWCIFQCLARAAFVIHHGSEDPKSPRYMKDSELILKLENGKVKLMSFLAENQLT